MATWNVRFLPRCVPSQVTTAMTTAVELAPAVPAYAAYSAPPSAMLTALSNLVRQALRREAHGRPETGARTGLHIIWAG
jgi:hypothetical protein